MVYCIRMPVSAFLLQFIYTVQYVGINAGKGAIITTVMCVHYAIIWQIMHTVCLPNYE